MKHLEEDWERLPELDQMYVIEKQREVDAEFQQWMEEQEERGPATIEIKVKGHETSGGDKLQREPVDSSNVQFEKRLGESGERS